MSKKYRMINDTIKANRHPHRVCVITKDREPATPEDFKEMVAWATDQFGVPNLYGRWHTTNTATTGTLFRFHSLADATAFKMMFG
ncbi:MAG: hypothetical protein EOP83_09155 [Verrucomicrobiaceae bacterium]|nr:MAG: hypothetical protein EOP83_09155 [Verrucomicrobiaceae bacterium]